MKNNVNKPGELRPQFTPFEFSLLKKIFSFDFWEQGSDFYVTQDKSGNLFVRILTDSSVKPIPFNIDVPELLKFLSLAGICSAEIPDRILEGTIDLSRVDLLSEKVRFQWFVESLPVVSGYALTIRRDKRGRLFEFDEIGFLASQKELIKNVFANRYGGGIIFVAGRSGAGKTNTTNAFADELSKDQNLNILELGDPIEIRNLDRTQISIDNQNKAENSAKLLQRLVRGDFDAIFYPDVRSQAEMKCLIDLALNGTLIVADIHAASVSEALERLLFFTNADLLAQTIRLIVSQNLVRTENLPVEIEKLRKDNNPFAGNIMAIAEVLFFNDPLKSHLRKNSHPGKLVNLAADKDGFLSFEKVIKVYEDQGVVFDKDKFRL